MTKPGSGKIYTCSICQFKANNSYIFKRHLHKCYSLHGIASPRSSPKNPIRLKGTENLQIKAINGSDHGDQAEEVPGGSGASQENLEPRFSEKGEEEVNVEDGLQDLNVQLAGGIGASLEGTEMDASDSPAVEIGLGVVNGQEEDADSVESGARASVDTPEAPRGSAPYTRHYSCSKCGIECASAKDHLYHQRDVHGVTTKIHECTVCDYASHYNNKVERHMVVHNRLLINMDDRKGRQSQSLDDEEESCLPDESEAGGSDAGSQVEETPTRGSGRLRVKPLTLRRLNVKMPFKVSGGTGSDAASVQEEQPNAEATKQDDTTAVYRKVYREDGSVYQCIDCLYYSPHVFKVKKHHELCHGKQLRCPHCDFESVGQGILYEHLLSHEGHGYQQCEDCSYVSNSKTNMEKHRGFHETMYPYTCLFCNFGSDMESKIKRHLTTQHTPDGGSLESVPLPSGSVETSIDTSMEFSPAGSSKAVGNGIDAKIEYRCPECPQVCYRRANYTRHLVSKHNYSQVEASRISKQISKGALKGAKRRPLFGGSVTAMRRNPASDNLKCSHCSYIAKWPSDLRRHMQVHTLLKRFKCTICPNKYKYLGDLNVHMRRDHNMEPPESAANPVCSSVGDVIKKASPMVYRCPICPFSCHSKADMDQHSRSNHENITKTYQCRICDYQTYWRGDVGRHLYRHHQIVLSKEAGEIGDHFIVRPDIRPLTKPGPKDPSMSQAVFPGQPEPLMDVSMGSVDEDETMEELDLEEEDNNTECLEEPEFDDEPPRLTPIVPAGGSTSTSSSVCLKEGMFVCEYPNCDFRATLSDRMEIHLGMHLNVKMFQCSTCGKRTNWKWDVVKHMQKVHNNPSASVEDVIQLSLEDAKATIGQYIATFEGRQKEPTVNSCSLCGFKSLEKNRVVRHLSTVHKNETGTVVSRLITNISEVENGDGSLSTAGPPGDSFLDGETADVKDDVDSPAAAGKFIEPGPEELCKYEKPFMCAICKKGAASRGDVKKHYNYAHPYKEVRIIYVGDGTEFNFYTNEIYSKTSAGVDSGSPSGVVIAPYSGKVIKPDSKFSNPRAHGYVKPFKCSICGVRSNWKWDLKKHLRSKHPNKGGFVIMMSIEEASETYGTDCTPSHPLTPVERQSPISNQGPVSPYGVTPSPTLGASEDHLFKSPLNIKEEVMDDQLEEGVEENTTAQPQFFPRSPSKSAAVDPQRQWKCSGCDYVTYWRRNIARHIHRKHPGQQGIIKAVALHNGAAPTQQRISPFLQRRRSSASDNEVAMTTSNGTMKLWRCPKCTYSSVLRTHIIGHMQTHEMKPFKCGVCKVMFMNRGPLHKHLQRVHKCEDYIRQTKVVIKYGDEEDGEDDGIYNDSSENVRNVTTTPSPRHSTEMRGGAEYVNSYFCRLCNQESHDRHEIISHLEAHHGTTDNDNNILKIQKRISAPAPRQTHVSPVKAGGSADGKVSKKLHFCHVCPYRSQKKQMLAFHLTYHRPAVGNRLKCKYCPFYVSTVRLLHQHQRKWHESGLKIQSQAPSTSWRQPDDTTPTTSPYKSGGAYQSPGSSSRRHACEKCPYTTNSKNDFIYHKQFHRPRRVAPYKCEYCDYWVGHKRLLKQHMKLHTQQPASDAASNFSSPAKSLYSDPGLVYDPAELTELAAFKQKMISSKITGSLSASPTVSPMKLASSLAGDGGQPGYVLKNGIYRKLHKCKKCPYTNIRARNMQLHELMHGPRPSPHPLMKCPYCDYYVGSKGLLSHHMKVHKKNYGDTPENDAEMPDDPAVANGETSDHEILPEHKADTLLQISRFKRFGCERCPYASARRQHFERHLELHGSRQRYTCQYCDYSVPSQNLLMQHTKLHLLPNQNLLASQSVSNLNHLTEVPADVALSSALPPADSETTVTISVIHDHLGLYENSIYDSEPKKLYRCDRCPYANVRRDYLLSHLKFHMVKSALACPYCDYSAPKQSLLTQHIRVHFCPLPELSEWLLENGQTERETSHKQMDLGEAIQVAKEYQSQSRGKSKLAIEKPPTSEENMVNGDDPVTYICQYCDRDFTSSESLIKHELQHLIGNHYERSEYVDRNKKEIEKVEGETSKGDDSEATQANVTEQAGDELPKQTDGDKTLGLEQDGGDAKLEDASQQNDVSNEAVNGTSSPTPECKAEGNLSDRTSSSLDQADSAEAVSKPAKVPRRWSINSGGRASPRKVKDVSEGGSVGGRGNNEDIGARGDNVGDSARGDNDDVCTRGDNDDVNAKEDNEGEDVSKDVNDGEGKSTVESCADDGREGANNAVLGDVMEEEENGEGDLCEKENGKDEMEVMSNKEESEVNEGVITEKVSDDCDKDSEKDEHEQMRALCESMIANDESSNDKAEKNDNEGDEIKEGGMECEEGKSVSQSTFGEDVEMVEEQGIKVKGQGSSMDVQEVSESDLLASDEGSGTNKGECDISEFDVKLLEEDD